MRMYYFDPISYGQLKIDASTILYMVQSGEGYKIQGISCGLESLGRNPHPSDTNTLQYWRISNSLAFISKVRKKRNSDMVFPNNTLSTDTFSLESIILWTKIDPTTAPAALFNSAMTSAIIEESQRARRTEDFLLSLIRDHFETCITPENYTDIKAAVDELYNAEHRTVLSEKTSQTLSLFHISETIQNEMLNKLTEGEFVFNATRRSVLEFNFTLSPRYPTHASRYSIQVDLKGLVEEKNPHTQNSTARVLSALMNHQTSPNPFNEDEDEDQYSKIMEAMLEQELFDFVRAQFKSKITVENLPRLTEAWQAYRRPQRLSEAQRHSLYELDISTESIEEFKTSIKANYPHLFNMPLLSQRYEHLIFDRLLIDEDQTHAEKLGELAILTGLLAVRVNEFEHEVSDHQLVSSRL